MEMTTITIDRAVVEQALEALEYAQQGHECPSTTRQAITALRAALTQQAEPRNQCRSDGRCQYAIDHGAEGMGHCPKGKCVMAQHTQPAEDRGVAQSNLRVMKEMFGERTEPGAWVASKDGRVIYDDASKDDSLLRVSGDFENDEQRVRYAKQIVDKLNAAPPQRSMVPLTEEEIYLATGHCGVSEHTAIKIARAVEKASWENNHGQA